MCTICSCTSTSQFDFAIPGETNVLRKNIATEYYQIAEAYTELKKYDKAATYYKLSMRDPNLRKAAYYKLGRVYVFAEKWEDAEKVFIQLLKIDSENQNFKTSLAYIYGKNGKPEKASELYFKLLETNPDNSEILVNYILLLVAQEKLDDAQAKLLVLKQKFPDSEFIEEIQNMIYTKLGQSAD